MAIGERSKQKSTFSKVNKTFSAVLNKVGFSSCTVQNCPSNCHNVLDNFSFSEISFKVSFFFEQQIVLV